MKDQPFENPDLMDILSENYAKIIKALFSDEFDSLEKVLYIIMSD